jgi:hypothetical protein
MTSSPSIEVLNGFDWIFTDDTMPAPFVVDLFVDSYLFGVFFRFSH